MKSFLPYLISLLVLSIISLQQTSSASFPNPPPFPPANASAEDWTIFWRLLHNYYAIIARPRFGKRYDSALSALKHRSPLIWTHSNFAWPSLYDNNLKYTLGEYRRGADDDQKIDIAEIYTLTPVNNKRRRRRR